MNGNPRVFESIKLQRPNAGKLPRNFRAEFVNAP